MTIKRGDMDITDLKERIATSTAFGVEERDFLLDAINSTVQAMVADGRAEAHAPRNYMGRIDRLWAALSVDDGGEGIAAAPVGDLGTVPLIAADQKRLEALKPTIRQMARFFGRPIRIAKFSQREDVEIIRP